MKLLEVNTITEAWRDLITPADYDAHMEMVGQARPLALGWTEMLKKSPLNKNAYIMIAGGGTGQFLDFVDLGWLKNTGYKFVITDINPNFLSIADKRIASHNLGGQISTQVYNLMTDTPPKTINAVSLSFVLEHLEDWQSALRRLTHTTIEKLLIQIQAYSGDTKQTVVTKLPQLRPSMQTFVNLISAKKFSPNNINEDDLTKCLGYSKFLPVYYNARSVPNGKIIKEIIFNRNP